MKLIREILEATGYVVWEFIEFLGDIWTLAVEKLDRFFRK